MPKKTKKGRAAASSRQLEGSGNASQNKAAAGRLSATSVATVDQGRQASPEKTAAGRFSSRWRPAYSAIPAVLAFGAYFNTLFNSFASDDLQQVVNNTFIRDLGNLPLAFTTTVWAFVTEDIGMTTQPYFRPMFSVIFTLAYALFGTTAWGWHLVSVLVHTGVTVLVFLNVKKLTSRNWLALMTASFFAVHPVHVESVAWISGVTDPLMSLFVLASLLFFLEYEERRRWWLLLLSLGLFLFGLLSKETAIALPIIILFHQIFPLNHDQHQRHRLRRAMRTAGAFLVPTFAYLLLRNEVLGGILFTGSGAPFPFRFGVLTAPLALVKYLKLLAVPLNYSYQHYTPFVVSWTSAAFLLPLAAVSIVACVCWLSRSRIVWFASILFLATLGPALAAIPQFNQEYIVQERYLYLPSVGFCLVVALAIEWAATRTLPVGRQAILSAAVCTSLIAVWVFVTARQNRVWYDTVSLFENCVAVDPDEPITHASLAGVYFQEGRRADARDEAIAALELDPQCTSAYLSLSYFASTEGKLDQAIAHLRDATDRVPATSITRPILATAYVNLGLLYAQRKNDADAEQALKRSVEIWPRPTAFFYAGKYYFDHERYDEARVMFEEAANRVPAAFAPIQLALGSVYERLNQRDLARAAYEKYLKVAPPKARERAEVTKRLSRL